MHERKTKKDIVNNPEDKNNFFNLILTQTAMLVKNKNSEQFSSFVSLFSCTIYSGTSKLTSEVVSLLSSTRHSNTHTQILTHARRQARAHSPCKVFWFCNVSVKRWQTELFWRSPCFLRSWWTQRQIQILFYLGVMQFSVERTIQSWHWFKNDHDPETNVETVFALYFLIMSVVFLDMLTAHL